MKILFFGDSITDMGRNYEEDHGCFSYGHGYVAQVAGELLFESPNDYEIFNRGISGNRSIDLYERVGKDVWELAPDVCTILIGVNDVWHGLFDKTLGVDIVRYEETYRKIIEGTRERNKNVQMILLEPFVIDGWATHEKFDEFLQVYEYAKVVKKLAQEYGLHFIPLQADLSALVEKYGVGKVIADGVHPQIVASKMIALKWLNCFRQNVLQK